MQGFAGNSIRGEKIKRICEGLSIKFAVRRIACNLIGAAQATSRSDHRSWQSERISGEGQSCALFGNRPRSGPSSTAAPVSSSAPCGTPRNPTLRLQSRLFRIGSCLYFHRHEFSVHANAPSRSRYPQTNAAGAKVADLDNRAAGRHPLHRLAPALRVGAPPIRGKEGRRQAEKRDKTVSGAATFREGKTFCR